jgi:hypothetical protein
MSLLSKLGYVIVVVMLIVGQVSGQNLSTKPTVIPLIAEREEQRKMRLQNGSLLERVQKGMLYKDKLGRTRSEMGQLILIADPVARATYVLDTDKKIARKLDHQGIQAFPQHTIEAKGVDRSPPTFDGDSFPITKRPLGDKVIEGLLCKGEEVTLTIPANSRLGNQRPLQARTEIWIAKELLLPLLVISDNPLTGKAIQAYKNIKLGVDPDPSLFRVPEGYRVIENR